MSDASRHPRLVVEGDSLSASGIWIPYALQRASASNRFALPYGYNQAAGGETALQMIGQVSAVNAIKPDVVVLLAGTNDLGSGATAGTVYSRLKTLWKSYLAAGAGYVVAVDIPPRNDPGWMKKYLVLESRRVQLNNMIDNLASDADLAAYKGRILVAKDVDFDPATDTIDGIHENAAGARKLGDAIGAALARMTFSLPAAHDDFDGDGRGDLLWRNGSGDVAAWVTGSDGRVVAPPGIGHVGSEWTVQGTGDLDGDGVSDILWRGTQGEVSEGLTGRSGQVASTMVASEARLLGTGDCNGNGRTDLMWRDASGAVSEWLLNASGQVAQVSSLGSIGSDWTAIG